MSKRKVIYSDIPRPYDEEATRLIRMVGIGILVLFVLALAAILCSVGA